MIQVCFTIISFDANLPAVMGHFELVNLQANTSPPLWGGKKKQKNMLTGLISHLHNLNHSPSVTLWSQIKRLHDGPSAVPQTGQHQSQIR